MLKGFLRWNRPEKTYRAEAQRSQSWKWPELQLLQIHDHLNRVRRDPGTQPVPNFFSSTRPVPTRKLKMTGYRVIKFHFESNKTRPRMRNPAYEVTNPINPNTFFRHLLRKVNKNRCSNLLSVPEANWLEKRQVVPYNVLLHFLRVWVCTLWRDNVSSCGEQVTIWIVLQPFNCVIISWFHKK